MWVFSPSLVGRSSRRDREPFGLRHVGGTGQRTGKGESRTRVGAEQLDGRAVLDQFDYAFLVGIRCRTGSALPQRTATTALYRAARGRSSFAGVHIFPRPVDVVVPLSSRVFLGIDLRGIHVVVRRVQVALALPGLLVILIGLVFWAWISLFDIGVEL